MGRDAVRELGVQRGGKSWPIPGIIHSDAPGMAAAVARPPLGSTSGSASPWITSVGTSNSRNPEVRSGDARMAARWRGNAAGWLARS